MLRSGCVCFGCAMDEFDYFTGKFALGYTLGRPLLMLTDDLINFGQRDEGKEP